MHKNMSTYSDAELYDFLRSRPKKRDAAFAELYQRHSQRVYLYCRRIVGDKELAEDIFQEAFYRFLKSAKVKREMTNVPAYLLRIARNLCLDAKKAQQKEHIPFYELRFPTNDISLESKELAQFLTMALELLPEEYREVFVLQSYDGFSYKEIAEILDLPLTTVRNRIIRSKRKIREILSPYLEGYR